MASNLPPGLTLRGEDEAQGKCPYCGEWHEEDSEWNSEGVPICQWSEEVR